MNVQQLRHRPHQKGRKRKTTKEPLFQLRAEALFGRRIKMCKPHIDGDEAMALIHAVGQALEVPELSDEVYTAIYGFSNAVEQENAELALAYLRKWQKCEPAAAEYLEGVIPELEALKEGKGNWEKFEEKLTKGDFLAAFLKKS